MRAAVLSSPLRISRSLALSRRGQATGRGGYPLAFQLPVLPERQLVRDGAALVGSILSSWSAPGWPDQDTARIYQRAMRIPPVAHTSLEYHRWFVRSHLRPDGLRYARHMRSPVAAPTLHLHGAVDPCVPAADGPRRRPVRRGAVPVEGHRGRRPLSARGAAGALRRRAARLAGRHRARPVTPGRTKRDDTRDRDRSGRPRNARPRDELGRPLPRAAAGDVPAHPR